MIRMFREGHGIKRAVLAADAHISDKTLERAEAGHAISEESYRRIARVLGPQDDVLVSELFIPAPEEAERLFKRRVEELWRALCPGTARAVPVENSGQHL